MTTYINPAQRFAVDWGHDGARFAVFVQGAAQDTYGRSDPIQVYIHPQCQGCHRKVTVAIKYRTGNDGIDKFLKGRGLDYTKGNLLMKDPKRPLGVSCGCYGKFQRQIVHLMGVVTRVKNRQLEDAVREEVRKMRPAG